MQNLSHDVDMPDDSAPATERSAAKSSSFSYATDAECIAEIKQLLAAFDSTPSNEMTPLFYAHAYNELDMAARDLLRILEHNHDPGA